MRAFAGLRGQSGAAGGVVAEVRFVQSFSLLSKRGGAAVLDTGPLCSVLFAGRRWRFGCSPFVGCLSKMLDFSGGDAAKRQREYPVIALP